VDGTLHGRRKHSLIRWPWKVIAVEDRDETLLFNLEDDPGELNDLAAREPERLQEMLADFETISPPTEKQGSAADLDDGIREQLEALGYVTENDPETPQPPSRPDHSKR
jgi:hypothetical protein